MQQNVINPIIIKPSSLNYKITLKQAVEEFIKKESKMDEYILEIQDEAINLNEGLRGTLLLGCNLDELDDILYKN